MPGRSSAWSRSRRSGRAVACNVAAWRTHSPTERCSTQAFPSPPLDGRSRRRAAHGSLTSIATAACGSTRWLGSFRTWRSRTSRRPVGACRSTSGSCAASGSTSSSRFSRTTRSTSSPGPAVRRRSRPVGAGRSGATAAAAQRSTASGSISTGISGRPRSRTSPSTVTPRRPAGLDEAGAARSARRRSRRLVAVACERHRPPRPRQQRRLLAGRRARAPVGRHRPGRPLVAELDYREPIDLDDAIELVASSAGAELLAGFRAADGIRAVARVGQR